MNKQQILLISGGALLFCLVYFFGNTIPPKKLNAPAVNTAESNHIDINSILAASRQELTPSQQAYEARLQSSVVRGDVKEQQIKVYRQLADFWRDSAHLLLPYAWYTAQAAKLENSQKSLTFAAQFLLEGLRRQDNPELRKWMATEAKELFENALQISSDNDSLKVGLGSCYLFGNIGANPMEGIKKIQEVAERDPGNLYAQFVLGVGGLQSGQLDKAIERLTKVAEGEPGNVEAVLLLAEACERKGDHANAIKWYEASKKHIGDNTILAEIDKRINLLKK